MSLAAYKDLCIDAVDPPRMARFWAALLALDIDDEGDGEPSLVGPTRQHRVWINRVPEAKTVKHRVHLDVHAESVDAVLDLGARPIAGGGAHAWTVVADPEGGELCVFPPHAAAPVAVFTDARSRLHEIVCDTAAPRPIAQWWADVLGARAVHHDSGWSSVTHIAGAPFAALSFVPVPEPKALKNRIHIDVTTLDLDALLAAGATVLRARDDEIRWTVCADPDGNEFCAFLVD